MNKYLIKMTKKEEVMNNSLVRLFRSSNFELKNASRDKKIDKLLALLNFKK
jgi:hypothetical protein